MKTLIKLIVAGLVLNACARGAQAAWDYYQLKDAAQQTVVFGAGTSIDQLREEIMRRAAALQIPLTAENLEVTRNGPRTAARASYTQSVELFPRYSYPFTFEFEVDALAVTPSRPDELP